MNRAIRSTSCWAALVAVLAAGTVEAQVVCSAPHSSPSLSNVGIGLVPPGAGWVQATAYYGASTQFFGPDGERRPFLADARTSASSLFVTAAAGIVTGIEAWAQVPLHRLAYVDQTGELSRMGIGDPRLSVRLGGALVGLESLPLTLRATLKLPGGEFPVDPNLLPISEGQTDVELVLEAGRVRAGGYPLHVVAWAGYRWRFEDAERDRDPGDELIGRLGVGGPAGYRFRWDVAMEGLWGRPLTQQGFVLDGASRRLIQFLPTIGASVGRFELEATARVSLAGRNLPAGPSLSVGVLRPWTVY